MQEGGRVSRHAINVQFNMDSLCVSHNKGKYYNSVEICFCYVSLYSLLGQHSEGVN